MEYLPLYAHKCRTPTSALVSFFWQEGSSLDRLDCTHHCSAFAHPLQTRPDFAFCWMNHHLAMCDASLHHSRLCSYLLHHNHFSLCEICPCCVLFRAPRHCPPFISSRPISISHTIAIATRMISWHACDLDHVTKKWAEATSKHVESALLISSQCTHTIMSGCLDRIRCQCDCFEPVKEWLQPKRNLFASVASGTLVCSNMSGKL